MHYTSRKKQLFAFLLALITHSAPCLPTNNYEEDHKDSDSENDPHLQAALQASLSENDAKGNSFSQDFAYDDDEKDESDIAIHTTLYRGQPKKSQKKVPPYVLHQSTTSPTGKQVVVHERSPSPVFLFSNNHPSSIPNISSLFDKSLRDMTCFPSPYELAVMSQHVYQNLKKGDAVVLDATHTLPNWKVAAILQAKKDGFWKQFLGDQASYRGAIYYHTQKQQIVLAHRGINISNIHTLKTNALSILGKDTGEEYLVLDYLKEAKKIAQKQLGEKKLLILTTTGHSVGGWLAQVTTLLGKSKYKDSLHIHCVTFDTPGAKDMLAKLDHRYESIEPDFLDITNYLSSPNLINSCNSHVGTLYRVVFQDFIKHSKRDNVLKKGIARVKDYTAYTLRSHDIQNFVKAFNPQTGKAKECQSIASWPLLDMTKMIDMSQAGSQAIGGVLSGSLSDIAKSIYRIGGALWGIKNNSLLGEEYGGFFDLANTTNNYDPEGQHLKPKKEYKLHHKSHYKTTPFAHDFCHKRHLAMPLRHLLNNYYNGSLPSDLNHISNLWKPYLTWNNEEKKLQLTKNYKESSDADIRLLVDYLYGIAQDHPDACQPRAAEPQSPTLSPTPHYAIPTTIIPYGKNNLPALPQAKAHMVMRDQEIADLHKKFFTQTEKIAIIGEGGMGKSTLACLYASNYFDGQEAAKCQDRHAAINRLEKGHYTHVLWLDAEVNNLKALGRALGIQENDHHFDPTWKRDIKDKLIQYPGWLLILDNVENIKDYTALFPEEKGLGHILITSRQDNDAHWQTQGIGKLPIKILRQDQSQKLLAKFCPPANHEEAQKQALLVQELGGLPLALSQVGHYLHNYHAKDNAYNHYLSQYQDVTQQKKLLEKVHMASSANSPFKNLSVWASFDISLDKVKKEMKEKDDLKETLRILHVMSLLHADKLDARIFAYLRPAPKRNRMKKTAQGETIDDQKVSPALQCLSNYGVVIKEKEDQKKETYRIHRLHQDIIRWQLQYQKNNKASLANSQDDALQLIKNMLLNLPAKDAAELQTVLLTHAYTLMQHIESNTKKCIRLLRLNSRIRNQSYLNAQLYLPPLAKIQAATQAPLLHPQVFDDFMQAKNQPVLLLTGEAGTGKSTYACHLEKALWGLYKDQLTTKKKYIPLFISLPIYAENGLIPQDIIQQALRKRGLDNSIEALRQAGKQRWCFIFDGYDEINATGNLLYRDNQFLLHDWGANNKCIITCRTPYLVNLQKDPKFNHLAEKALCQQLFGHPDTPLRHLEVAPFTLDQVDSYIQTFAESDYNPSTWQAKAYQDTLQQMPQLREMMTSPFLLGVVLRTLPKLFETYGKNIQLLHIYEAFTDEWLQREISKPEAQPTGITKATIVAFCEELGYQLVQQDKTTLQKKDPQLQRFFDHKTFQNAPLRQVQAHVYQFIQPSYRDFFGAQYLQKNIRTLPDSFPLNPQRFHKNPFFSFTNLALGGLNLQGLDWTGVNLQGTDFSKANLTGAKLQGANLTHATLQGANFTHVDFTDIDVSGFDLSNCDFSHAINLKETHIEKAQSLQGAIFQGVNLQGLNLSGIDLSHCDFSEANLAEVNLKAANLTHAKLAGATLENTTLQGAKFIGVDFADLNLSGIDLSNCNFKGAINLKAAHIEKASSLQGAKFEWIDFEGLNLSGLDLSNCNFTWAKNLKAAHIEKASSLQGAKFEFVDFAGLNLSGLDLSNCDFTCAKNLKAAHIDKAQSLQGAKFRKVDFEGLNLSGIDLSHCNFEEANLEDANLTHVNLTGANLKAANLECTEIEG
ncbi:MAG: pentapeptide repeat-containing protein, partial [Bacteroidota bacterium]